MEKGSDPFSKSMGVPECRGTPGRPPAFGRAIRGFRLYFKANRKVPFEIRPLRAPTIPHAWKSTLGKGVRPLFQTLKDGSTVCIFSVGNVDDENHYFLIFDGIQ
ncbi:MAG: hypothetical protein ISR78_08845 [Spirochaetia bacterium]|nr:hypothetical protein [Spirochaetia bacterium]